MLCWLGVSYGQITRVIYKVDFNDPDLLSKFMEENKTKHPQYVLDIMENALKEITIQEFELVFDKKKSIFNKIEVLSINSNISNSTLYNTNSNIYYKNIDTKQKIYQSRQTGEKINVIIPFDQYKWEITNESKTINGYKCFKAKTTAMDYDSLHKKEMILNRIVWFTPEIPSSFGPKGFDGLPGLVLETTENDKNYLHAIKIEFNFKKEVKIEKPKCDKTVTEKEFGEILAGSFKKIQDEMGN